jgi:hypothetical protein
MKILWLIATLLVSQPIVAQTNVNQQATLAAVKDDNSTLQVMPDLTTLPLDKGLPVVVRVGVFYQNISAFDENTGVFTGTVDSRLSWDDLRLRYPAADTPRGFQEYRGPKAEDKLKTLWSPGVAFTNLMDDPSYQVTNVRIFPTGRVEVMQRTTAQFSVGMDAGRFPFDQQTLAVEVEIRKENSNEAELIFLQEDLDFSRASQSIALDGWDAGLVNIKRQLRSGWYGEFHSALIVGLEVQRQASKVIAPIFIPLIPSLLIPLVGIWMNQVEEEGEFKVEAFELANVVVGGLFAVIALNFSINSAYTIIASGDNTVSRLFGLNYVTLGIALGVVVFMYRFNTLKRVYGSYVQEEAFLFLLWAVPVLVFGTATALIAAAMVG